MAVIKGIRRVRTGRKTVVIKNNLVGAIKAFEKSFKSVKARQILNIAKEKILSNMDRRYNESFMGVGSRRGLNVPQAVRDASRVSINQKAKEFSIFIADEDRVELLTQLPNTRSSSKQFSLFTLLREGWGKKGGKGGDNYALFVMIDGKIFPPTSSALSQVRRGTLISTSNTKEIYNIGGMAMIVKHPGFKGRDWILFHGEGYGEDQKVFKKAARDVMKHAAGKFNKFSGKMIVAGK